MELRIVTEILHKLNFIKYHLPKLENKKNCCILIELLQVEEVRVGITT